MRLIGKEEIENISIGAALLGTGGGGDPYIGKLMAIQAVEKYGPIKLLRCARRIQMRIAMDKSGRFSLKARIPKWCFRCRTK